MKNYFSLKELKCKCGYCNGTLNPEFLKKLNALRHELNFPFIITSGYRCENHNELIGGAKNSAHLQGRAVDIKVIGEKALMIIVNCIEYGFNGVGVSQKGNIRFVHIDDLHPNYAIWSY